MRCLVTGATGLVGSHLVAKLRGRKVFVRALVRKSSDVKLLNKWEVEQAEGNLLDRASLSPAMEGIDTVFHCAALVTDWAKRHDFQVHNVYGVRNVLEAAWRARVKRFVHVSSCEVYGNPGIDNINEEFPVVIGQHPYTDSKVAGEKLVRDYIDRGMEAVILRPSSIYGPRSISIVKEIAVLLMKRQMILVNQGRAIARLCYVENLADALILAAGKDQAVGQIYNVTDGCRTTWKQFVDRIAQEINAPLANLSLPYSAAYSLSTVMELFSKITQREERPLATLLACRMFGTNQYFSIEKIKRDLGFAPEIGFDEGMAKVGKWLRSEMA
jgi:nucleoside-diphosphate-sugar epimerase